MKKLPDRVLKALKDKSITKTAFNAQFERVCINKFYGLQSTNWECTMIKAWSLGFPGRLEDVGKIIGLEPDQQKLMTGKNLIRIFSIPQKSKANKDQISLIKHTQKIQPSDRPEEWGQFKLYCGQDVTTERAIRKKD